MQRRQTAGPNGMAKDKRHCAGRKADKGLGMKILGGMTEDGQKGGEKCEQGCGGVAESNYRSFRQYLLFILHRLPSLSSCISP